MDIRLYFAIAAIILILYGLGFLLIPAEMASLYGVPPEAHITMTARFWASALLALGVINWLARDFQNWTAMRAVLIGGVVDLVVAILVAIWSTTQGLVNSLAWGSTIVNILLLLAALYFLFTGSRKVASAH